VGVPAEIFRARRRRRQSEGSAKDAGYALFEVEEIEQLALIDRLPTHHDPPPPPKAFNETES
jgi:hypothetical protein